MEYINTNFVSLRDLEDIDTRINELSERKLLISSAIKSKTANDVVPKEEVPGIAIEGLVQAIKGMLASSPSLESVENLIRQNGELAVLRELRQHTISKNQLETRCLALKDAAAVEAQLETADPADSSVLGEISKSIAQIQDSAIQSTLSAQLNNIIDSRKSSLVSALLLLLADIKWLSPSEKVLIPSQKLKEIVANFTALVDLQAVRGVPEYPNVWWAVEVLVQPFVMRFNYHFNQSTETNKISKPEWALSFVESFFGDNMASLELVVGNAFVKHNRIGPFEVLTAALVPVREKLLKMAYMLNDNIDEYKNDEDSTSLERNGRLLSHLIFETTSFDQRLRHIYKYNPHITDLNQAPQKKWMGLTGDILLAEHGDSLPVNNWLALELRLANKRFSTEIIGASNAFEIDYEFDASSNGVLKPSYSAYALVKLFDNLTTHFKTLTIVKYQLKYVSNIQLTFLDEYLEALEKSFGQFQVSLRLKLISNFLPSAGKADTNSAPAIISNGLKGLEILTGLYCLIKFVAERMEEWSEDLVFIQLWNSYKSFAASKVEEDSIFDSALKQYSSLLLRVFNKYEEFFRKEVRGALKEYVNSCVWTIETPKNQPSPQLSNFITILPAYMSYLKRSLPEVDYFLVSSKVCDTFASVLHEYVITNNKFNKNGVEQLKQDFDCMVGFVSDILLLDPESKFSNAGNRNYNKVKQSIELMGRFDATTAKVLKTQFSSAGDIREEFENKLDCLSDHDCNDLLHRIV